MKLNHPIAGLLLLCLLACDRTNVPPSVVMIDPVQQKYENWLARGKTAIPEIREILADDRILDFRLRTHALLAAGRIGADELAPEIARLLRDAPHPAVKNCAVIALADLRHRDSVPLLLSFLPGGERADATMDRGILLEQLGRMGDERAIPALIAALQSDNSQLQLKAQNALVEMKAPAAVEGILAMHEKDGFGRYDKEVAVVLGALDHPRSGPALLKMIWNPSSRGQIAAVNGAGALKYGPALPALVRILQNKPDQEADLLEKQAGRALARLNAGESVGPLIALFEAGTLSMRLVAAETLAEMTVPEIPARVHEALKARPKRAIVPAAYVLGLKGYTPAAPDLRALYKQHDGTEAFYTAQALGRIGDRESIPLLLDGLEKRAGEAAYGAAFGLGAMKAREAVAPMIRILKSDNRDLNLKKHCVAALGEIGDPTAAEAIIALPLDEKAQMGDLVGRALGKLGGETVFAYLRGAIDSDDLNERRVARFTLLHFQDPEKLDFLLKLLENQDPKTRRAAMSALRKNTGKQFGTEQEWVQWARAR